MAATIIWHLNNWKNSLTNIRMPCSWVETRILEMRRWNVESLFSFRLVFDFLKIFEHIILILASWTLSTICCSLLMVQYELVEYNIMISESVNSFKISFNLESIGNIILDTYYSTMRGILGICWIFFLLLFWWTHYWSLQRTKSSYLSNKLVFMLKKCSTNDSNDFGCDTKCPHFERLWERCVLICVIQKGKCQTDYHSFDMSKFKVIDVW